MPAYDLQYQTSPGRCAWCWEPFPPAEPHITVSAKAPPRLVLEFHRTCWEPYRSTSGVELKVVGSSHDWTPERIETLRVSAGMPRRVFCKQIGLTEPNYVRMVSGDMSLFGPGVSQKVRQLAAVTRYESQSPIDWSDGRAVFCLRMHLKKKKGAFALAIGCSTQQAVLWEKDGVPRRSVRTWGRLARVAAKSGFDAAQVVEDRLWTAEFLSAAVAASGRSFAVWAAASGWSYQAVQQWAAGTRPIHREAAWGLTRAATELGAGLPPGGVVGYRMGTWSEARKPPSPENEAKRLGALREAKWGLDALRALGTAPDREIAARLGRTRNGVAIMRRALGVPTVDARYWDGTDAPPPLSDAEIRERWERARVKFKLGKAPEGRPT